MDVIIKQIKMQNKQKIILSVLIFFIMFFVCGAVLGDGGSEAGTIPNPLSVNNLSELLDKVVQFVQALILILAPIFIVWAGITFITSGGEPAKIQKGRNILLYTVIGIIVALLAQAILKAVTNIFTSS